MSTEQDPWAIPLDSETASLILGEDEGAYDCLTPEIEAMDGLDGSQASRTTDSVAGLVSDLSGRKIDLKSFMK